jgi:hypothetical protein
MMGQKSMRVKRTLLLLTAMAATLIAASGVALAVNKVCSSGSTQSNPCSGTTGIDTLIGTSGVDYIKGLAGNDKISGGAGNDTTDGGGGNDTYSYKEGWGQDTLIDSGGSADALNFSAVASAGEGVDADLRPELSGDSVDGPNGERIDLSSGTVVEKITGSSKLDFIRTAGATNTLQPGPGTGGAFFVDFGGCPSTFCSSAIPASNDTYSGFAASGYGPVQIRDFGGKADTDKLVLPFASTDVYFEVSSTDNDGADDTLLLMTSSTDSVQIFGQLDPHYEIGSHIEQIRFTDVTMTIGSETAVQALNAASALDATEKEKRSKAAKKIKAAAEKKAQDLDEKLPASGAEDKR